MSIRPVYIHYKWEERTRAHKAFSYFLKIFKTIWLLVREKPHLFYVQAPPAFPLYVAYIYSSITGAKYVVDAHNAMIYGSFWCKMPFAIYVLKKSSIVIVHNEYVSKLAKERGIPYIVLMD